MSDGRAALHLTRGSDTYRVVYAHWTRGPIGRLQVMKPDAQPEVAIQWRDGAALEAVRYLDQSGGDPVDAYLGTIFVPDRLRRDFQGVGGELRLGRSRFEARSYALLSLTGAREDLADDEPALLHAFPRQISGLWVRADLQKSRERGPAAVVGAVEELIRGAHGLAVGDATRRLTKEVFGVVRGGQEGPVVWTFVRRTETGQPLVLSLQDVSLADFFGRAPFANEVRGKRVSLIGCGAVGWTVALELARSGVTRFTLYEDDVIRPYNLARLDSHLGASGRLKIDALADQLAAIAPGITVEKRPVEVGTHVGAAALLSDAPDLLVNLTGEEISTEETNAASLILGRPAIFGWVSNGVFAGRIIRVRPGQSPCYQCIREAEPEPIRTSGPAPQGNERPWEGASFDVDAFACAVARSAVLTLVGSPVSADINPDHVVLDFGGPTPVSTPLTFKRDPECGWCR
jgi:molybdopterin/thiamine biosynthesis adenylyltransferase